MTAYVIADIQITDPFWVPAYAASVHDIVARHGGKYLSRSGNVKTLEGEPLETTLIAVMAFPTPSDAEAFVADPDYAPYRRGPEGRQQKPFPDDRRHRPGRDHSLPSQGLMRRSGNPRQPYTWRQP